jgi:hypothetical protein
VILTTASHLDRFSQGKASLFVLSDRDGSHFHMFPKYFEGIFPFDQLLAEIDLGIDPSTGATTLSHNPPAYRRWPRLPIDAGYDGPFVAGYVVARGAVEVMPIDPPSDIEEDLGTTHVLGMPLFDLEDFDDRPGEVAGGTKKGQRRLRREAPLAITVDLRLPALLHSPFLYIFYGRKRSIRRIKKKGRLLRREARDFLAVCLDLGGRTE